MPEPTLSTAAERLAREFAGILSKETIERFLEESVEEYRDARIRLHVPALVERFARSRLRALALVEGGLVKDVPEVLFVCVHNAGRSQMAAALLDRRSRGKVHVMSAGSTPADEIHPGVVQAMAEIGIDLSKEFPKPLTDEVVRAADVVITMGCGDACPVYPGKRYLDWDLPDPGGKPVEEVRAIRDEIDRRITTLVAQLVPAEA
jgi:arsenate reductase (thioredoxin)